MNIQKIDFSIYGRRILERKFIPVFDINVSKIYYIHDGWIDVKIEDQSYRLEKGHLYLIPNVLANIMSMYIEYVDHTYFDFFTFPCIRNSEVVDIPLDDEPLLKAHIHALSLYVEKYPLKHNDAEQVQLDFVASSLRNLLILINEKIEIISSRDEIVEKIIDFIYKEYMHKLSVTELAKTFHLEKGALIRRFKRYTAMTPYRYIKLLRVNRAQTLIKEGNQTLEKIAQAVGYADASTLSHAIKTVMSDH